MVQACLKFPILSNPSTAKKYSDQNLGSFLFKPSHLPPRTEGILGLLPRRAAASAPSTTLGED